MHQGKVKWFNNAKGYGFIVEDGGNEDLFAHFSSIQMDGYKTLKAGQAVTFEKQPSGKGTHAVNICALETAGPDSKAVVPDDEFISVDEEPSTRLESSGTKTSVEEKQSKVSAY
jgi:CspA family cold shock protein